MLVVSTGAAVAVADPPTTSADDANLTLGVLGTHRTGQFDQSAAEIVAFDPGSDRAFVVNAQSGSVDVLDASDPSDPTREASISAAGATAADGSTIPAGAVANSVDVRADGLVVVAVESNVKTDHGWLLLVDGTSLERRGAVRVGAQPDMVTLTPDGRRAVVANEGEPAQDYSIDPEGSVAVIDLPADASVPPQSAVAVANFHAYESGGTAPLPDGVRVFGPEVNQQFPVSANLEPEYIALDPTGRTAYVTLQENNAFAVVDLASASVTGLLPLGAKDHSVQGQGLDPSDRDGGVKIGTWPVKGLYMPDTIHSYQAGGRTYLVTADEGDARQWGDYVEPARVKDLGKKGIPSVCADSPAADLRSDADLGRLNVSTASGLSEDGSCFEQLYSFGGRSFSIWSTDGSLVFDSGDAFEQITAKAVPGFFNSNHTVSDLEGRSDDKGPEPEAVTVGSVGNRTYAFVGFERVGGIAVFDITSPGSSTFETYLDNRDFSVSVEDAADQAAALDQAGDLGPESIAFVTADDSPTGAPMLVVGNEVSGTTTFYSVTAADDEPATTDPGGGPVTLTLYDDDVQPGDTVRGVVEGVADDEDLSITLFSDPVDLGTVTAADGMAMLSVVVPQDTEPGGHTLVVEGDSGRAEAPLTVRAAAVEVGPGADGGTQPPSGGLLPDAGSPISWVMLAIALGSVAAGVTMLRRRRA